jgi:hypothetical protein
LIKFLNQLLVIDGGTAAGTKKIRLSGSIFYFSLDRCTSIHPELSHHNPNRLLINLIERPQLCSQRSHKLASKQLSAAT